MPVPRRLVVRPDRPGFYHCVNRCVRRAHLCGDQFEHRRRWLQDRLRFLAGIFAIDVAGYAILTNHLHLILWTDPRRTAAWSRTEVARRWVQLFPRSAGVTEPGEEAVRRAIRRLVADDRRIALYRRRLGDLSWFMRCLAEPIARRANREDDCSGRFWQGRFTCRALLDVAAVLACVVYVDLNVIRAKLATLPEHSDYTSVQDRIRARGLARSGRRRRRGGQMAVLLPNLAADRRPRHAEDGLWLVPIEDRADRVSSGRRRSDGRRGMFGFPVEAYLELVDATGRIVRGVGQGSIPAGLRPILERLEVDPERWSKAMKQVSRLFGSAIGSAEALTREAVRRGTHHVVGALDVYRPGVAG